MKFRDFVAGIGMAVAFAASAQAADLKVEFADPTWTGGALPGGMQCEKFGGSGATPPLKVSNIPAEATAIIVEFNDRDFGPLSSNAGHGAIGFWLDSPGQAEVTLPSVPGHTKSMPPNAWLHSNNKATGSYATDGYLPPCSGGKGHVYEAIVKAVKKEKGSWSQEELTETTIVIGKY